MCSGEVKIKLLVHASRVIHCRLLPLLLQVEHVLRSASGLATGAEDGAIVSLEQAEPGVDVALVAQQKNRRPFCGVLQRRFTHTGEAQAMLGHPPMASVVPITAQLSWSCRNSNYRLYARYVVMRFSIYICRLSFSLILRRSSPAVPGAVIARVSKRVICVRHSM